MMTEQQQEQEKTYQPRLAHLKQYIRHIKHQINYYQPHHHHHTIPTSLKLPPSKLVSHPHYSPRITQLHQEKQQLLAQISTKEKVLCGLMSRKQNHGSQREIMPYLLKVHCSRVRVNETLAKLVTLLEDHDWEHCGLYQQPHGLVVVGTQLLTISKINYTQIEKHSIEKENNYLRFVVNTDKLIYYIFNFPTHSEANKWYQFFDCISSVNYSSLESKWLSTQVKLTNSPPQNIQLKEIKSKPENKFLFKPDTNDSDMISRIRLDFTKKYHRKEETDKSSFYLSNSSDKDNEAIKDVEEELKNSFQFEPTLSKQSMVQLASELIPIDSDKQGTMKQIFSTQLQKPEAVGMTMTIKLLTKLEEKKKLLNESSATRLGIHWHEDAEQKISNQKAQENQSEKYLNSPTSLKLLSNHKSLSSRNNQESTRRDSNESPLKRVESATRHKSNSRDSQDASAKRKKTDFSLQLEKVQSSTSKKKSSKHEIRDHYLQKLIQKEAIKEVSKSSGKDSSSQMQKDDNTLLTIPERREKRKPSSPNLSRYGSIRMSNGLEEQDSLSQDEKEQTEIQIQIQELKNGIVLQKCSKEAWSTKQKKLYISNAMTQICYCDVHNSHEEKKYFIKDIKSIEYGHASKGILKHKKQRCDEGRCLLIHIDNNGNQKLLQFYLDESQPVQNLQEFSRKLQNYVHEQNQESENQSD